jgi:hypothetical protein
VYDKRRITSDDFVFVPSGMFSVCVSLSLYQRSFVTATRPTTIASPIEMEDNQYSTTSEYNETVLLCFIANVRGMFCLLCVRLFDV